MTISVYSLIVSLVFYNVSLLDVFYLRRRESFLSRYTTALLGFLTLLGVLRLFAPLDFKGAYVFRSYRVVPAIEDALRAPLVGKISLGALLLTIWGTGTLVLVLRDLWTLRRYRRAEKAFPLVENKRIERIADKYGDGFRLIISPAVKLPYVTGLFHPAIYVPDIELSDEEWRNVFRHETQHIRAHDEWKKLFFRVVRAVFWWNPLAHISESEINTLIELACDARVAGSGNFDEQEAYLRTMLTLMKREVSDKTPALASRLVGTREEMKLRFETLLAPKDTKAVSRRRAMALLFVILFLLSYTFIVQPAHRPPEKDLISYRDGHTAYDVSENVKGEDDQFILLEDGEYKLYINGQYVAALDEDTVMNDPQFNTIPIIGGN